MTVIDKWVTTGHLVQLFRRIPLTIGNWRRYEGLPYVRIPGDGADAIRYDLRQVTAWAKKHGKRIHRVD
jgi:hypothetical protein